MAEAVIFDMDGVLVNSEPYHFKVEKLILKKMGITITDEELLEFVGLAMDKMWGRLKERYSLEKSISTLVEEDTRFRIDYFKSIGPVPPIEGVKHLAESIRSAGLKTAVASSSHQDIVRVILDASGLAKFFPIILSGFQVKNGKPDPDIFIETARLLDTKPGRCVVIEDSYNGVRAAKAAGMICIGYSNPFSGNQDLSGADRIISSFSEIETEWLTGI